MEMGTEGKHAEHGIDDDGKPRRTGTFWTASAHIITAVIGSGVLSLAWAMAQLGWVVGVISLIFFSVVTYYTSIFLTDCYRSPDPVHGKRNYTYMEAVEASLGTTHLYLCGLSQYINLFGSAIGYTITAAASAQSISKTTCYHYKGHDADCRVSESIFIVSFGVLQVFLSQLPNFNKLWWLSILSSVMSFVYSLIAIGLSAGKAFTGKTGHTTMTGVVVGVDVTAAEKTWYTFQALGNIAFAYSYSMILIEIQDTLKSRPAENKVMKKASLIGVSTTTTFYVLCAFSGYVAFGNNAPGNILTGFADFEPFWLVNLANLCIIVHLVGAYQVYSQPLFYAVESYFATKFPTNKIFTHEQSVINTDNFKFSINIFRLGWRIVFVVVSTLLSVLMPFFNDILGLLGALGFWPLTVYFPIEMYIKQRQIRKGSPKWMVLEAMSFVCFVVSVVSAIGSVQGIVVSIKSYKPFQTKS